jgi:hypothetical protein
VPLFLLGVGISLRGHLNFAVDVVTTRYLR